MINLTGIKDNVVLFWTRFVNSPPEIMSLALILFMFTSVSLLLHWAVALFLVLVSVGLLVWGLFLQESQDHDAMENIAKFYGKNRKEAK